MGLKISFDPDPLRQPSSMIRLSSTTGRIHLIVILHTEERMKKVISKSVTEMKPCQQTISYTIPL